MEGGKSAEEQSIAIVGGRDWMVRKKLLISNDN